MALRESLEALQRSPSPEHAEAFADAVERAAPNDEVTRVIDEALASPQAGDPMLRVRLVEHLLSLGFPHALHVTPEDLELHRRCRELPLAVTFSAGFTCVAALVSGLWSLLLALVMPSAFASHEVPYPALGVGVAGVAFALVHAVKAFIAALGVHEGGRGRTLANLGLCFVFGPVGIALCGLLGGPLGAGLALTCAAPAMATALLCGLTAGLLRD